VRPRRHESTVDDQPESKVGHGWVTSPRAQTATRARSLNHGPACVTIAEENDRVAQPAPLPSTELA
jgi:hypothetical protein